MSNLLIFCHRYAVSKNKIEDHNSILQALLNLTENLNISISKSFYDILFMIYEALRDEQKQVFGEIQGSHGDLHRIAIRLLSGIKNNFDIFNTKKLISNLNNPRDISIFGHKLFSFTVNGWTGLAVSGTLICLTALLRAKKGTEQYAIASSVLLVTSLVFFGSLEGYRYHLSRKLMLLERKQAHTENNTLNVSNVKISESDSLINKGVNYGSV